MSYRIDRTPTPRLIGPTVGYRLGEANRNSLRHALGSPIVCIAQDDYAPTRESEVRYRVDLDEIQGRGTHGLGMFEAPLFLWLHYARYRTIHALASLQTRPLSLGLGRRIARWWTIATRARDIVVLANTGIAGSATVARVRGNEEQEEATQIAILRIIRCVDTFDASRGWRFSTYSTVSCVRAVLRNREKVARSPAAVGLPAGLLGDNRTIDKGAEQTDLIRSIFKEESGPLDALERQVLAHRFGLGELREPQTLKETGLRLSLSSVEVRKMQQIAIRKVREWAEISCA